MCQIHSTEGNTKSLRPLPTSTISKIPTLGLSPQHWDSTVAWAEAVLYFSSCVSPAAPPKFPSSPSGHKRPLNSRVIVQSITHALLLWLHETLLHTRPPCPSLSPGVCSKSHSLSQWCHPTISSSVTPFFSCPQSFPASGSFPMIQLFASGWQSFAALASASVQFSSVAQSCPTVCDPMDCSTPGLPVHHQLLEFTQTHAHWVSDAIQPSHPLSSPSPPTFNLSQHQGLLQWGSSLHQVTKVLEFQLQHHSF